MSWGTDRVWSTNYDMCLALSSPGARSVTPPGGAECIVRPSPATDGVGWELYIVVRTSSVEELRIGGWRRSSCDIWGWVPLHALNHWRVYETLTA